MKILISNSAKDEVSIDIKLTGSKEAVDRVSAFLSCLDYNGAVGHSATFALPWDGDGSDKLKVEGIDHKAYRDRVSDISETKTGVEIVR